jgi:predicted enzyme related to lactoylglutathione lyase
VVTSGGQVVVPKSPVPGVGWLAHCKDTDGNVFGMLQPDAAAA